MYVTAHAFHQSECHKATRANCSWLKSRMEDTPMLDGRNMPWTCASNKWTFASMTPQQNTNTYTNTRHDGVDVQQDTQCNTYPSCYSIGCQWHQILPNFITIHTNMGNIPIKILRFVSSLPICCSFRSIPFQTIPSTHKNRWALGSRQ